MHATAARRRQHGQLQQQSARVLRVTRCIADQSTDDCEVPRRGSRQQLVLGTATLTAW